MSACPVDRKQIERIIDSAHEKLELLAGHLVERERAFHQLPSLLFLAFSAASQVLGQERNQYAMIRAAFEEVDLALRGRIMGRFGGGRRCAEVTRAEAVSTLEVVRKAVADTRLLRGGPEVQEAARGAILYPALFDFCVYCRLLAPSNEGHMIAAVNSLVSEVLASGELDRNVVKIR